MCCGRRRAALQPPATGVPSATVARQTNSGGSAPIAGTPNLGAVRGVIATVMLHYKETAAIRVWGPVTGQHYDFSGAHPARAVDPRDASVLTRSGLFRRL
jgi:hypothetical protein